MSTVEQLHHLETRIERILSEVRDLRSTNAGLREALAASEDLAARLQTQLTAADSARAESDRKLQESEQRLSHLRSEQDEIEAAISRTLKQLGQLELGGAEQSDEETPAAESDDADDDEGTTAKSEGSALDIF